MRWVSKKEEEEEQKKISCMSRMFGFGFTMVAEEVVLAALDGEAEG